MVAAATTMPVPPSTTSVGRYSSYNSSYSSYRPSSYLNRTTSLERSNYGSSSTSNQKESSTSNSSYGSGYSTYSVHSKYARPPRPSYSATSDTYRSSRSLRVSPVRTSYSTRISSDSRVSSKDSGNENKPNRYSRDSSVSKDSGYGSRFTSRDRSIDMVNGNGIDVSSFGPSPSSYAFNYRWEGRHFGKEDPSLAPMVTGLLAGKEADVTENDEKVRVSDRIKSFEPNKTVYDAREHELESIANRRRRLGLAVSPPRETKSRTPISRRISPERNNRNTSDENENARSSERRPSVTELARKYDTNHNVSNGINKSDEEDTSPTYNCNYTATTSPKEEITVLRPGSPVLIRNRRRHDSSSKSDQRDSPSIPKEITITRVDSPVRNRNESPSQNNRLESPARTIKDSPAITRLESPNIRSESPSRKTKEEIATPSTNSTITSTLLNGTTEKVSFFLNTFLMSLLYNI